jgi:hypothetical protein
MMNTPTETLFVKKYEVARAICVSARTVDNWAARRTIPYIAVSPRMHLFDLEEVTAALREKYGVSATDR